MLQKLLSAAIFSVLLFGQGAVSAPQPRVLHLTSTCGRADTPPCPSGQLCCPVGLMTPAERNACVTGDVCLL
ncbi:hypothetical protein DFH09DRAFT_1364191 [Mycena vulgaris]|nr:hypothetical protein DFH09DRAFT_1364191 [Mycena vulgaris]